MAEDSFPPTHELFDHTADIGLRVYAPDLEGLFAEAARALCGLVVENLDDVEGKECVEFELASETSADLLVDWLGELLYTFEIRHLVFGRFEVVLREGRMRARAWGEPLDPVRHRLGSEVKAVTYHGLALEHTEAGWIAEFIVDI